MDVREANKLPHAPVRAPQSKLHPCVDALPSLHQATQRPHVSTTKPPRHRLGPASSLLHASTSYYCDYHAVRDRRGRTTRAGAADAPAALHRLMDTDEAMTMPTPSTPPPSSCMENAKQRPKTTTTAA